MPPHPKPKAGAAPMCVETILKQVVATVLETRIHIAAEYDERRNAIAMAAATVNCNVAPNTDTLGRLHAPVDGYTVGDATYGKGEFIPMPETEELLPLAAPVPEKVHTYVESISGDLVTYLKANPVKGDGFKLSVGASWEFNGVITARVYISSYFKRVCVAVAKDISIYQSDMSKAAKAADKATRGDALEGRHTVTGKVVSTPSYANDYGHNAVTHKLVIELPNRSTAYGTLPTSLYDAQAGDTVTLTATFTPSEDDRTHATYKRPSKATLQPALLGNE